MISWLKKREGSRLAVIGLVVAAVLFVAVNVFAAHAFRNFQADLTEGRLYSLSDGTRQTLVDLKEPIDLRLYFSKGLGDAAPAYGAYFDRVRELLSRYTDLSDGRLRLQVLDPEPFSDAEDGAVADGLQGVPLSAAGDTGYFGLAGTNSTDGHETIGFFNLQREPFLEYDLTKLVFALANPEKPVIGVVSGLPPEPVNSPHGGGPTSGPPQLLLLDQVREFFNVLDVPANAAAIPDTVKALLVLDLNNLPTQTIKAIDRFVHAGNPAMVLMDPVLETSPRRSPMAADGGTGAPEEVAQLLATWGLKLDPEKVAVDLESGRQVNHNGVIASYPVWMALPRTALDTDDPVMAGIERLNLASVGVLQKTETATTTVNPLIETSTRSGTVDAARVRFGPDFQGLLRDFKSGGNRLMLAARVQGPAKLAFPTESEAAAAEVKPVNLILVADSDLLFDRFWVSQSGFMGQQLVMPLANNADFVVNALENLVGSQSLAGLRGRGTSYRPFTMVEELRRDADMQFRAKEEQLQTQLRDVQQRLSGIEKQQPGAQGQIILSAEDRQAIEQARGEMLSVRKELRDVQLALRQEIEQVETWVKVINIAAVPLLLIAVAIIVLVWRRHRGGGASPQAS